MHASSFEYNISGPYPLRWFTPVVIIGATAAVVLLSLLNFVSSGYTLVAQYSNDPNATVANTSLQSWPYFLTTNLQPICDSVNIPVDAKLSTNKSALKYTLTQVVQNSGEPAPAISPALIYYNNVLRNCTIDYISIRVTSLDRTVAQIALLNEGIEVYAYVVCRLDTPSQRRTAFSLTAQYNYMPDTVSIYSGFYTFLGRDKETKASLYWGESLLSMYWIKLASDYDKSTITWGEQHATQGIMTFTPNRSISEITNPQFFNIDYRFVVPFPDNTHAIVWDGHQQPNQSTSFWGAADTLANSMYSTVLTDLGVGNDDKNNRNDNILTNPDLLEEFTSNFTDIFQVDNRTGPAHEPFDRSGDQEALKSTPSTLSTTYLCKIPQRKPIGNLLLSILLEDLVFLQALWLLLLLLLLLKMFTDNYVKSGRRHGGSDGRTNVCEGCLKSTGVGVGAGNAEYDDNGGSSTQARLIGNVDDDDVDDAHRDLSRYRRQDNYLDREGEDREGRERNETNIRMSPIIKRKKVPTVTTTTTTATTMPRILTPTAPMFGAGGRRSSRGYELI